MGLGYQAVNVKAPEFRVTGGNGQPNTVSDAILYTFDTTHLCTEIPEKYWGKYVRITITGGGDMHYVFTDKSTHEIDRTIAATNAGAQDETLGGIILSTLPRDHVRIGTPPAGGKMFFSREGTASGTARIELASD